MEVTKRSSYYNGANSDLFVDDTEIYKFKTKDSKIEASPLCLGKISKDWSVDNMKKKTGFTGYVYHLSADYDSISVDDIKDIHNYLIKKNDMYSVHVYIKCFDLLRKFFFIWLTILSGFTDVNSLSCISMSNQACKERPDIINVNSNNLVVYPFSFKTS